MGRRGPESEEHQKTRALEIPGISEKRPSPPAGMTKRARRNWKIIVASLPSTHFRPGDYPLLRGYCEAEALHFSATKSIEADGAVVELFKMETDEETGKEIKVLRATKANPWVAIQTQCNNTMSQLATKLRLAVNSRLS